MRSKRIKNVGNHEYYIYRSQDKQMKQWLYSGWLSIIDNVYVKTNQRLNINEE